KEARRRARAEPARRAPAPARGAPGPAPPRFRATGPCREATPGSRCGSRRDTPARFLRPGSSRCAPRTTPRRDALRGLPDGGESATRPRPWPGSSRVFAAERRADPKLAPDQEAVVLPPWILEQSPAGSSTKDFVSRAFVACPAQECAPSAQSFFAAALMP